LSSNRRRSNLQERRRPTNRLGPCVLEGNWVRLQPLREGHAAALLAAAGKLDWGWFLVPLRTKADVDRRISDGLKAEAKAEAYAFAVITKKDRRVREYFIPSGDGSTEEGGNRLHLVYGGHTRDEG